MGSTEHDQVDQLLQALASGDRDAAGRLFELVYAELRSAAHALMAQQSARHTLAATALVHEAYLKLVGAAARQYHGRGHFVAVAATAMRQVLISHARARSAEKRGGGADRLALADWDGAREAHEADLLALDDAMTQLSKVSERAARIAELRIFGGLGAEEIAALIGVSPRTVEGDWATARLWLAREMRNAG